MDIRLSAEVYIVQTAQRLKDWPNQSFSNFLIFKFTTSPQLLRSLRRQEGLRH